MYGKDFVIAQGVFDPCSVVLCDVYTNVQHEESGRRVGMPILYYRAHTEFTQQDSEDAAGIADDIYYYVDNYHLLSLGDPDNTTLYHPLADGVRGGGGVAPSVNNADDWLDFEDMVVNDQVTAIQRPYKAESYILVSAGKDGLYGNSDDILNFTRE